MVNEENVELNKILLLKSFMIPDNERHLITLYTTLKCFTCPYASITNTSLILSALTTYRPRFPTKFTLCPQGNELSTVQNNINTSKQEL